MYDDILPRVKSDFDRMVSDRRYLHAHPGVSFDISETLDFVSGCLDEMGVAYERIGRAGLVASVGDTARGKTFLVRADMDALPIREQSGCEFAAANGCMHACGHDLHTAMLLEAARVLKTLEGELSGRVLLMFQPSEETFEGARDMIDAGLFERYTVDAGMMEHVTIGLPCPVGTVVVNDPGVSAPAADYFSIDIQGHGCHGSMPNVGIDPITVAAHTVLALQEIHARELAMSDEAVLTIGSIHAGDVGNAIPDTAQLHGTIRTYDEALRAKIKERMVCIAEGVAAMYRATAAVSFGSGCPTLLNDAHVAHGVCAYAQELLGEETAFPVSEFSQHVGADMPRAMGSEDFSYVSHCIPTVMVSLAAGNAESGNVYPQHHPQVTFDEKAMVNGTAVYAYAAMRWLEDN